MKALRILAVAVIAMAFFGSANAQVVVKARIGAPPQHREVIVRHPYHHRTVVVNRGYRHYHHRHAVVVVHPRRY